MSFSAFGLNPKLLIAIQEMGFESPTAIQSMAIPPLMEGKDVLATAVTGSGKTAAFLLPILNALLSKPRGATRALILAPTRELAAQIAEHMRELSAHTPLKGAAVFGGVSMGPQEAAFRHGADVIIATPGRLLDHFQYPYAKMANLEYLVLDEADRMLDMGFLPDIRRVLGHIPRKRQTFLFSATMPLPIVELAQEMLHSPVAINVHKKSAPAAGITHIAYPVPHDLKSNLLLEILKRPGTRSVLAFTRTKHRANRLASFLERRGVSCAAIHGNRSQLQRTEALAGFKKGKFRVLVATDIAARGIDVEALSTVINFDVPNLPEDYIHRVGRTARLHAKGDAYTFVSPDEEGDLSAIERHLGKPLERQKVEGFDYARKTEEKLEIPLAERIAAIRARKAEERARSKAKVERRGNMSPRPQLAPAPTGGATEAPHTRRKKKRSPKRGSRMTGRPVAQEPNGNRAEAQPAPRQEIFVSHKDEQRGKSPWPKEKETGRPAAQEPNGNRAEAQPAPRQEIFVSHKDEQRGKSHWAKEWLRRSRTASQTVEATEAQS